MDPWHALKVRRRWLLGLWLGWLPFMGLLEWWQRRGLPAPWAVLLAVLYLAGLLGLVWQLRRARCPGCGGALGSPLRFGAGALWLGRCQRCATAPP